MRFTKTLSVVLATAPATLAHSWIEYTRKIAPNGTMVGDLGFARGWMARTEQGWSDSVPMLLLPPHGQAYYSGEEIINKYPFEAKPKYPMLQAAPGDRIAVLHTENGHTTLPQNQPYKPKNRGTIFFYGTANPKPQEKLFDVHLRWSRDGTGGDKRGRLLAAGNYDDGQCYQPNPGALSIARADKLATDGATHDQELLCQSDIQLPSDLKPGSIYTVYWYWDWPDLDAHKMRVQDTGNGIFPWAGTFMRGEKDPHGFTMDAISRNESYASTFDIQIVAAVPGSVMAKDSDASKQGWIDRQNIYTKAIQQQIGNNFQVDIDANAAGHVAKPTASSDMTASPEYTSSAAAEGTVVVTVTQVHNVTAPVGNEPMKTVFVTVPAPNGAEQSQRKTSTAWDTVIVTRTTKATPTASSGSAYDSPSQATRTFIVTPVPIQARRNWAFGADEQ